VLGCAVPFLGAGGFALRLLCCAVELRDFGHCGTLEVRRDAQAAVLALMRSFGTVDWKASKRRKVIWFWLEPDDFVTRERYRSERPSSSIGTKFRFESWV
jgi:hypothetical protein